MGAACSGWLKTWADMAAITIYHNPACGTSRTTLALIRNSGEEPEVIEYLKTPPDKARLQALLAANWPHDLALRLQKLAPHQSC